MTRLIDDVFSQPAILRRAIDSLSTQLLAAAPWRAALRDGQITRVVFTAMGGSFSAVFPAMLKLIAHGIEVFAVESSELLYDYRHLLHDRTLVIAVSQSGESVEVVKLFDAVIGQRPVIGVTNTPGSSLARRSQLALFIGAGEENAVSTKTYTCTLTALDLLTAALLGEPLEPLAASLRQTADTIEAALPGWQAMADTLAASLEPVRFLIFMGRGIHRASALASALIVKETAKLPTEGMVTGQFRHGPMEVMAPGVTPFIFMGSGAAVELHRTLAQDFDSKGIPVVTIGAPAFNDRSIRVQPPDPARLPLAEIVPIQLLAAALATRSGIEPGTFFHSRKVTTVE